MEDWILYEVEDEIATITINRPEKKNAMSYKMLGDFIAVMDLSLIHISEPTRPY